MRGTIAAIERHYNKNEATCDKQIAANHDALVMMILSTPTLDE
jgi:hypothetical protein